MPTPAPTPAPSPLMQPTAVFVPLSEMLKEQNFELVTKEIFGPFQVRISRNSTRLQCACSVPAVC